MYSVVVALIFLFIILFFVIGIISPKHVFPKNEQNPNRKKVFLSTIVMLILFFVGVALTNKADDSNTSNNSTVVTVEQKKEKSNELVSILSQVPQYEDKVEKSVIYKPWGEQIPPQDAVYWYAISKDNFINERIKIVNFSDGIDWIFWDKIIFSTDQNRWDYEINSFVGQSGGGKSTQIVMGGKYEFLDVPFEKLAPGIKILIEGSNPIIRLKGDKYKFDYVVPDNQIEHLKAGYKVYEDLKATGGMIIDK